MVLSGKARQVFRYLALVARYKGHVKVKDWRKDADHSNQ